MVSPPEVWPPSSAYKLQRPWKRGGGGMMRLRLWPGGGWVAVRAALAHLMERWPEREDPMGVGEIQQPLAGVTQAPWDFTL